MPLAADRPICPAESQRGMRDLDRTAAADDVSVLHISRRPAPSPILLPEASSSARGKGVLTRPVSPLPAPPTHPHERARRGVALSSAWIFASVASPPLSLAIARQWRATAVVLAVVCSSVRRPSSYSPDIRPLETPPEGELRAGLGRQVGDEQQGGCDIGRQAREGSQLLIGCLHFCGQA